MDGRDYHSTPATNDTFTFLFVGQFIYVTIPLIDNLCHNGKRYFLFGITSKCGIDIWIQIFVWDDERGMLKWLQVYYMYNYIVMHISKLTIVS